MATCPVCKMQIDPSDSITAERDGRECHFCSEGCRDRFLQRGEGRRESWDLIIIGGGPAGLTAAVYAATMKLEAFLIAGDLGGQAVDSTKIENYMGFDFITGPELVTKFEDQLIHSHYIDHLISQVDRLECCDDGFLVTTEEPRTYLARTVIVATGMTRRRLRLPGEEEFQRRGVFYGNLQDYSFVHGEAVAVVGGGNSALQMVENLATVASRIHLISNSELTGDKAIIERVTRLSNLELHLHCQTLEFTGAGVLQGIAIRDRQSNQRMDLDVRGVFVSIGLEPNSALLSNLVDLNERLEVIIAPDCSTTCPGLFAAGDVTDSLGKRIIIASGEGAKAALGARHFILERKKLDRAAAG